MANRPVCCLALALLMGVLFGTYGNALFLAVFFLFLLFVSITILKSQQDAWQAVVIRSILCVLFFCLGFCHLRAELQLQHRLEAALKEGAQVTVQGSIQKIEEKPEQYLYYLADTHVLLEGTVYPGHGVLVYSSKGHMQPGNILKATGTYAPFQISRNEGNFNEKQYYQSKKIMFRLYAQQETLVSSRKSAYAFLSKVRRKFRDVYLQCMPKKDAGLLADITLGDKTLLDKEIKDLYQAAGISHVLAISGLHISLLGMGMYRLLRRLFFPDRICALFSVGIAAGFGLLSGLEVSTLRALIMFGMGMAARTLGCNYDSATALGLSFLIQIWENPFLLSHAGFLFSYSAVLGAAVIAAILRKSLGAGRENENTSKKGRKQKGRHSLFRKCLEKYLETLFASGCIQLAALPLSLYFYYEIPCYSIFTNCWILPLMGPLLFISVAGAALGCMFLPAGKWALTLAGWILAGNEWACRRSLQLPGAVYLAGKPGMALILLYYAILVTVLYLLWRGAGRKWLAGIFLALGIILFVREKPRFEIDVLDVGQGDGILIQTEEGEHFFVDGGSRDVKEAGIYRILPFLKSKGIASIKGWMVSHGDQDHISGLEELLEAGYPIEYLVVAEGRIRDEASEHLLKMAEKAGCKVVSAAPGRKLGTESVTFTAWHPKASKTIAAEKGDRAAKELAETAQKETDRNGASLVITLECHGFTGIFTGDIGEAEEQAIINERGIKEWMEHNGIQRIDFYKGAHHGSNGSNSREFLEALSPRLAVISCGKDNSYGHPGAEAMERLRQAGSQVFCTMDHGQITVQYPERRICLRIK